MAVVQLHGADICLQSVHGLVLLLVQHPEDRGRGEEDDRRGKKNYNDDAEKNGFKYFSLRKQVIDYF